MNEPPCSGTRRCPKCGDEKHVLAFAADPNGPNGLNYYCRECHAHINRNSHYRRYSAKTHGFILTGGE